VNGSSSLYRRHRFTGEIISHCVWLYYRFSLSYRDIEEMMAQRGVRVSHETIRQWCLKFGQTITDELRRRRPRPGDKWHLDEVYIKINGRTYYLLSMAGRRSGGRCPGHPCAESTQQAGGDKVLGAVASKDAIRPRIIVTDKLKSYGAAIKELNLQVDHRQHKGKLSRRLGRANSFPPQARTPAC